MQKVSYVERVLIVLNADGTLKGAHQELISGVQEDDGTWAYAPVQGQAEALSAEALSAVLPEQAEALAELALARQALDAAQEQIQVLQEQIDNLSGGAPTGAASAAVEIFAIANFTVSGDDIGGVEQSANFAAAMKLDTGVFWVFPAEPLEGSFMPFAYSDCAFTRITMKDASIIEISTFDISDAPCDPTELTVEIKRVK